MYLGEADGGSNTGVSVICMGDPGTVSGFGNLAWLEAKLLQAFVRDLADGRPLSLSVVLPFKQINKYLKQNKA